MNGDLSEVRIDTAVHRVAVLQDTSEAFHNPVWDVARALSAGENWQVQTFGADSAGALLDAQLEFDCVVLAHNVLHKNPEVIDLINERGIESGLVVMHQMSLAKQMLLPDGLQLDSARKPSSNGSSALSRPSIATGRRKDLEQLLNWPHVIDLESDEDSWRVVRHFGFGADQPWRPVLEVDDGDSRVPVILRSPMMNHKVVVTCNILIEPHREAHRQLLLNLVSMCSTGRPDFVVASADESWRVGIARQIRVRGQSALSIDLPDGEAVFREWPIRGTSHLVVNGHEAEGWLDKNSGELVNWQRTSGGRATLVEQDGSSMTCDGAPDVDWIARRYASWCLAQPQENLTGSLIALRAHLRLLSTLDRYLPSDNSKRSTLARFGLRKHSYFLSPAKQLLNERLSGGNVDETVAATVAALDVNREFESRGVELLSSKQCTQIGYWLRARFDDAVPEDQFEIARVLRDSALLTTATANDALPLSVIGISRVRQACVASDFLVPHAAERVRNEDFVEELCDSIESAAEYLLALFVFRDWNGDHGTGAEDPLVDNCIATMRRRGGLIPGTSTATARPQTIALEAEALTTFLEFDSVVTGFADSGSATTSRATLPPPLVDDILREISEVRQRCASLEVESKALTRAQHLIAGVLLAATAVFAWLLWPLVNGAGDAAALVLALVIWLGVSVFALERLSWMPPWARRLVDSLDALRKGDLFRADDQEAR